MLEYVVEILERQTPNYVCMYAPMQYVSTGGKLLSDWQQFLEYFCGGSTPVMPTTVPLICNASNCTLERPALGSFNSF